MIIFAVGPVEGGILSLYSTVAAFQKEIRPDLLLCTGSLGVWPDPQVMDRASRKHRPSDFADLYLNQWPCNPPLYFVPGPHDDHDWLRRRTARGALELMPGMRILQHTFFPSWDLRVTGMGGVYSPTGYKRAFPEGRAYCRGDVKQAAEVTADILDTHESPRGYETKHGVSRAEGLTELLDTVKPKLLFCAGGGGPSKYGDTRIYPLERGEILPIQYERDGQVNQLFGNKVWIENA